jgi:hypothetical protein
VAVWQGSCITLKCVPFCSWLLPFCFASNHSKSNEDLRQQNSELEEKLRVLVAEKAAAQLGVEELQKKLEMSELLLQQVRGAALTPRPRHTVSGSLGVTCSQMLDSLEPPPLLW